MAQISWDPDRYEMVNRHPVNQAAKRLLQDTEAPQGERTPMFAHQLARWVMKQYPEAFDRELMPRMLKHLDETEMAWTPEQQLGVLLRGPAGADDEGVLAEDLLNPEELAQMSPEDAAEEILAVLHENLMLSDVTYPWNHSQDLEAEWSDPQELEQMANSLARRLGDASSG